MADTILGTLQEIESNLTSGPISLPSGAATSDNQTNKSQFTKITDGIDTALVTAAGEVNVLATAQPGVDIGDVTVNNASGASAVNIQDGGNSITVDGTLAVTQSTSPWVVSGTVAATQSGTWTVQPGNTANTTPWLSTISQGGNSAVVKAASTAPIAADPALVVALSPNSAPIACTTSSLTTITKSTTSQVAVASNASRKGFLLWNDTTAIAFVGFGFTPTTSSFSVRLPTNTGYEPAGPIIFTGNVNVIWGSSGGAATFNSTEYT